MKQSNDENLSHNIRIAKNYSKIIVLEPYKLVMLTLLFSLGVGVHGISHLGLEKIYGYNYKTDSWHCLECGIDMGRCNPRQLCGKTYCSNF